MEIEEVRIKDVNEGVESDWEVVENYPEFEICDEYPHPIRNRKTGKYVRMYLLKGYNMFHLRKGEMLQHHRIIAQQFIENPLNLPYVDHLDRNRQNNHIQNLRWVSCRGNTKNRTRANHITYELVEILPDDAFVIPNYNNHEFNDFHYSIENDKFYFFTGADYRVIPIMENSNSHYLTLHVVDINGIQTTISINKFKKIYNIL
jgi:hypothetical protein